MNYGMPPPPPRWMYGPYGPLRPPSYERRHNYTHIHNYHLLRGSRSACATNAAPCCLTGNPEQVTCLNCARKLGPQVPRGMSLMGYGWQVRR